MIARKLGLGLDALLAGLPADPSVPSAAAVALTAPAETPCATEVPLDQIRPNPVQPRTEFDESDLASLASSIRASGILEPLVVRRRNDHYELVAGERRLRAARLAGLSHAPVVVREVDDHAMLTLALVENIQRRDLNPMEKARAFRQLLSVNAWSQDQVAAALGLSRPTVANFIRLLELPPEVQEAVSRGTLSMGHARALLGTSNRALQLKLLQQILNEDLSVRAVEKWVAAQQATPKKVQASTKEPHILDLEQRLSQFFGTRVTLTLRAKGGEMVIDWFSTDQFNALLRKLGV